MSKLRDGVMKRGATWSYVVRVTDPATGVSKPRWVGGFSTEKAAKEARDEARVKARHGQFVDRNRITVGEYLTGWLDDHSLAVKPRTVAGYRDYLNRYVIPRIGRMRLQAVKPATLTSLYRELRESGGRKGCPLSARSVEYVHAILRKAFNDAVRSDRLIASNPADNAKRPRREIRPAGSVWTTAQLRVFLDSATAEHRLRAFYRLAAYTGARRGELLNLRWADVDWKAPALLIRGSVGMVERKRIEGTTKGGLERVVSLDAGTVAALRDHQRRQAADRLTAGASWIPGDLVFTTELGGPLYPDTVTNLFAKLIRQYNEPAVPGVRGRPRKELPRPAVLLPVARLHDLRHLHATMLLSAGVPVHVVAARLGHADPSITLKVYAHIIKQHAAGVADTFAAAADVIEDQGDDGDEDGPGAVSLVPC
jgi:integrase